MARCSTAAVCVAILLVAGCDSSMVPSPAASATATAAVADQDEAEDIGKAMKSVAGDANFAFVIPTKVNAPTIEVAAKVACEGKPICSVFGWTDAAQLPSAWPMLDREVAAMSFRYAVNRNSGYESTEWFCGSTGAKADCRKADAE